MARDDGFDIFSPDPFGRDIIYGLSTGQEPLGLAPPQQGLPVDTRPYDRMQATPRGFISGLFSDVLGRTLNMPSMPRTGIPSLDLLYANRNPLFNLMGVGDVQKTAERISYGQPLTTGSGMTTKPREETLFAGMAVAPLAPAAGRLASRAVKATEGMPVGMSIKDVSYRGSHLAPNAKNYGATLDDLTKILPEDVYSQQGKQLYGFGDRMIDSEWRIAALKARGKPNAEVEIFRAVPKGVKDINSGDWVSTSKTYAKQHGETTLGGDYEIISKKVPAKTLSTEGYPYEYGYNINFEYPQQAALDLAQQRAALPVSEGGLGLPANNTPMDRARAMGFGTEAYHGTNASDITKFDLVKSNRGEGTSVALTPENAQVYGNITYPLKINQQKIFDPTNKDQFKELKNYVENLIQQQKPYDKDTLSFYPFTSKKVLENLSNPQTGAYYLENEIISKSLKDLGYSGSIGMESGQSQLKIFDPDLTRSRFAAFDPFRKDVATATAMGVALPDLLAQPVNQYQPTYETTPMYTDPFGNTIGSSIR